jgi:hypothetical protein
MQLKIPNRNKLIEHSASTLYRRKLYFIKPVFIAQDYTKSHVEDLAFEC